MEVIRRNISLVIAALLAFMFQLVVTPAMTIELIRPNALLAFCVVPVSYTHLRAHET